MTNCPKLYSKLSQIYLPLLYGTHGNDKKAIKILILISIIKMTSGQLCLIIAICQKAFYYSYICHLLPFSAYLYKYKI